MTTHRALPLVAVLAVTACGAREEGLTVDVQADVAALPAALTVSGGRVLAVSRATLSVPRAELVSCPGATTRLLRALSPIGTAWAHPLDGASPLWLQVSSPVELTQAGPQVLGRLRPPPGRYCRLVLRLGGDVDADGSQRPTLSLDGTLDGAPFHLEAHDARPLTREFDAVTLSQDDRAATLHLALSPASWLEGLDVTAPDAPLLVMEALARSALFLHHPSPPPQD